MGRIPADRGGSKHPTARVVLTHGFACPALIIRAACKGASQATPKKMCGFRLRRAHLNALHPCPARKRRLAAMATIYQGQPLP
eukprot:7041799-Pyramimonas_sp.AAC.1